MANIVTTDAKPAVDTLLDGFRKPIYDLRSVDTKYEDYIQSQARGIRPFCVMLFQDLKGTTSQKLINWCLLSI